MVNRRNSFVKTKSKNVGEEIGSPLECNVEIEGTQSIEGEAIGDPPDESDKQNSGITTAASGKRKGKGAVRSSNRVVKKVKKEISPPSSPVKKQVKIKSTTPEGKKPSSRKWELWSKQDQQLFYDGLAEFGKDFDAIYRYISLRQKKRGCIPEMLKNRNQIRHFYYRAWHKISKWITFKDGIRKSMQEVYALINYGEFRKKVAGGLNPKLGDKLNELFHTGVTNVKIKGKIHKLRTPVCRALKKINNIEEPKEEELALQLPDEIVVELRPKTNKDWARVHSMSQNPRLRMHVKPDRRLSSILNYAQKKWRPHTSHLREVLDLAPSRAIRLRLAPMGEVTPISLKINPPNKRMDMGLDVVKANLREISIDQLRKYRERKKKQKLDEQTVAVHQDDVLVEHPDQTARIERDVALTVVKGDVNVGNEPLPEIAAGCSMESLEMENSRSREPHDAESENARLEVDELVNLGGTCANTVECMDMENVEINPDELANLEEKFRTGWTDCDAHEITVAEIYLILKEPDKVCLQYEFVDDKDLTSSLNAVAEGCQSGAKTKFATAMEKLLMVARTQFINLAKLNKQASVISCGQCTCGAGQDGSPSTNRLRHKRSPATPKQAIKRSASPSQARITQRRGTTAAKKELDMNATTAPVLEAAAAVMVPELPVVAPEPGSEFRIPRAPVAPAGARLVEPAGQRFVSSETMMMMNNPTLQNRQLNLYQQLDALTKQSIAPLARNKMRLKQIRPRSLMAKPPASRQLVSLSMVPGGENVQKAFMPITGVVARHIGPMPGNANTNGANYVPAVPTLIGVKLDDVSKLIANVVPVTVDTPISSQSDFHPVSSTSTSVTSVIAAPSDESSLCSISNILDISLPPSDPGMGDSDSLIDMALNNNPSFAQYLRERPLETSMDNAMPSISTPAQSPLKLPDFFLNAENSIQPTTVVNVFKSGDLSLGSILDSPVKRDVSLSMPSASLFNDNSRDSITNKFESQVDSTLQYMMNESSVDYISKFADLAAEIADNDNHQKNDHVT